MKAIIWDLDETLWEGTIYHDETVFLKPETKEVLKQLDKLGIKQYVCSHNRHDAVIAKLKEYDILKYFEKVCAGISQEKDIMIKNMLDGEDLSPEEIVFIDDTGMQRELVMLNVGCHVDYETDLYKVMKYFDTDRLKIMEQQRDRTDWSKKFVGSRRELLTCINNKVSIRDAQEHEIPRITNLANRTNELNAARTRYTERQIQNRFDNGKYMILVAHLQDKFGDFGLIGEVMVNLYHSAGEWFIKDLCVSCRTMGRGVGGSLLDEVIKQAKDNGIDKLRGYVLPVDDNRRMSGLFTKYGFVVQKKVDGAVYYELQL